MLRTKSGFALPCGKTSVYGVWAFASVVAVGALGACSPGSTSSANGAGAGASTVGAAGATGSTAGSGTGGTGASGGGASGASSGMSGASSGGASGSSAGGVSGASGGSAGMSAGIGASAGGNAGSAGLGGSTNDLGTISGSPVIAQLLALTKNCTTANQIPNSHTYKLDNGTTTSICSLKGGTGNVGGAIYYTADMDIDCDGITTAHCPGTGADMDCCYQDQTSFHGPNSMSNKDGTSLASENTPYVVIPQDVKFPGLDQNNGGNIIAVIYDNQLEFGVFGDQGPSDIIGEASVRTANGLGIPASPATGGVGGGVTYIVFVGTGSTPADMENIPQIQSLGATLTESLLQNNP
jgi:Fungal chitosanase of glycosyl hydrolase group 75